MADQIEPKGGMPECEPIEDWHKRKREEHERRIVTMVANQLDALYEYPQPPDWAGMRKFFKLSNLLHKLLYRPA